jgi:hypothetical protein
VTGLLQEGVDALVTGNLFRAERAFTRAAALAPDPESRRFAETLAARVRQTRLARTGETPPKLAPPRVIAAPEENARTLFLTTTALAGVALWGWTTPLALGLDIDESPRGFIGLYLLTGAASFVVPYFATRDTVVTYGQANLAFYGATRGMEYGVLVRGLLWGDRDTDRTRATSFLLGSVGGAAGGYYWARAARLSPGQARTIAVLGDYGLLGGFAVGTLLGLDQQSRPFEDRDPDAQARGMSAAGLLGTAAGLTGGFFLARNRDNTWGDGEVMRAAGALGVLAGTTVAVLGEVNSRRGIAALLLTGGTLGLVAGDSFVSDTDFTPGQALLVDLSMVAGALGGAGVAYLIAGDLWDDAAKILTTAALIGGGAGYVLAAIGLKDDPAPTARRRPGPQIGIAPQLGPGGQKGVLVGGTF